MKKYSSIFAMALGLMVGTAQADTVLVNENFQSPMLTSGTADPAFTGWVWVNGASVKSRHTVSQSDVPGDYVPGVATNQVIQFEYTTSYGTYDIAYNWARGEAFILTINASPQSWNGDQVRYIEPSILQQNGTVLWSRSVQMPLYNNFGRNPWTTQQTFTFVVWTDDFTTGTEGQPIRLKVASNGYRGMYVDNVYLTVGPPPVDNDPPTPNPMGWESLPSANDYRYITMTCSNAIDSAGIEYLFTNTVRGTSSGWQAARSWSEGGLNSGTLYTYMAKARDKSPNKNETGWSPARSATTPSEPAGIIAITGFQCPLYADLTVNPGFYGWTIVGKSVRADVRGDGLPGSTTLPNQTLLYEQTTDSAVYDTTNAWSASDVYRLTFNASPQEWSGTLDRYIEPSILQQNGTVLWSATNMLPKYTNTFLHADWKPEQTFTYDIRARGFTSGTQGQLLRLKIMTSGQRGVYIDNVSLVLLPSPCILFMFQ